MRSAVCVALIKHNIGTDSPLDRVQDMDSGNDSAAGVTRLLTPAARADRFAAFIAPHYDVLFRTAYRFTRSVEDAEDLVQEVCVRAYPELERLVGLERPRAWLIHVMRRLFIDQTRRYERRHVESMDAREGEPYASELPGPLERTERALESEQLERAWRHLDRDQQSLLALHEVEGYSLAELAEFTGMKQGTLKSRLHRARVKLGRLLAREQGGTGSDERKSLRQSS